MALVVRVKVDMLLVASVRYLHLFFTLCIMINLLQNFVLLEYDYHYIELILIDYSLYSIIFYHRNVYNLNENADLL